MRELLTKFPETTKVVKEFYLEKLLNSIKNSDSLPEDFKEYARQKGVEDENVAVMMETAPRQLFDVFDAYELYIEIGLGKNFRWRINDGDWSGNYEFRPEAEKDAIVRAYELLNNKLKEVNEVS